MKILQDDKESSTSLDTIKKQPPSCTTQIEESSSSSGIKKALFDLQRNTSVPPNTGEISNLPGLIKKQHNLSRGTPPPIPPNKPNIAPKKDIVSFIKKNSIIENNTNNAN